MIIQLAIYKLIMAYNFFFFFDWFFEKKKVSIISLKNFSFKCHSTIRLITITYSLIKTNNKTKNNALKIEAYIYIYI